jgi:uncharacterized protein YydD (DUF2326 family)
MKILELKIKNSSGEIIRDIEFSEIGISFIFGDILEPKNLGGTINSLGKTLLLKCIDYIFGKILILRLILMLRIESWMIIKL